MSMRPEQRRVAHGSVSVVMAVAVSPPAMVATPPSVMVAMTTAPVMVIVNLDDRSVGLRGWRGGDWHGKGRRDERERNDGGGNQNFHEDILFNLRRNLENPACPDG